jgi:hypothetical protein
MRRLWTDHMNIPSGETSLFIAIVAVGALAYLGSIAFDPLHPTPRAIAGYVCGAAIIAIGVIGLYIGGSFEVPLMLEGVYIFVPVRVGWIGLGFISLGVGAILLRQAFTRG